jgi:energy-coupling factor transport system permease protein
MIQDAEPAAFLHRLNPLSKLLATAPALVFLALTTDPYTPLAFILLTALLLLTGGRVTGRLQQVAWPLLILLLSFVILYPLAVRRSLVQESPLLFTLGPIAVYTKAVLLGLAAGLRIIALLMLSLLFSLTTDASDFVRALVQQWRLPYRVGYSALAIFRFAPMLQHEFRLIQVAHQVRGVVDERGAVAWFTRLQRYMIPLLATAIRQAERTALAMDGRAFGAYPQRTYYRCMRFTRWDYGFTLGFWLASLLIVLGLWWAGLLGPLVLVQRL